MNLELDWKKLSLESLAQRFDVCIYSGFYSLVNELSPFRTAKAPPLRSIFCPHGNSDKGHFSPFMEGLSDEKWAFVYGKKMVSFLKEKSAHSQLENVFYLGNYRYEYFKKHRGFYQKILNETFLFQNNHQTLLYAPTWNDNESSSSFDLEVHSLIDSLPPHWNLIIKPHPHIKCEIDNNKENLIVLKDFPPIYPLLDKMDVYLGDMSSIGYDFLTFRRPLFFYPPKNRTLNYDTHQPHVGEYVAIRPLVVSQPSIHDWHRSVQDESSMHHGES